MQVSKSSELCCMLGCQEPMGAPPEGILAAWLHAAAASSILTSMHSEVTHREHGCGVVQHIEKISHNGTSRGFSVIFGDGTRSQPRAQVSCCDRPFMSPES